MRETYIPLFQNTLTSSVWVTTTPETRIVWVTLLLLADPEGYVCTSIPGLAHAARVTEADAREAIKLFEAPDPDSRSTGSEGRRLERVERGWRIINFEANNERARHEAEKARKRKWINAKRDEDRELLAQTMGYYEQRVEERSEGGVDGGVDASKSKSKSKSKSPERDPDPERARKEPEAEDRGHVARTYSLPSEAPPKAFIDEALMDGVSREQALSTWAHYYGAGLPRGGIERLYRWLSQRAKERTMQLTKVAPSGRPAPRTQDDAGVRGHERIEAQSDHVRFANEHGLDVDKFVAKMNADGVVQKVGTVAAWALLTKGLEKAAASRKLKGGGRHAAA